jgi:hypothetical protein
MEVSKMPKEKEIAEASDVGSQELTEDLIRLRAYQIFEQRGFEHGYDLDDWLQAEAEVIGKKPSSRTVEPKPSLEVVAA